MGRKFDPEAIASQQLNGLRHVDGTSQPLNTTTSKKIGDKGPPPKGLVPKNATNKKKKGK